MDDFLRSFGISVPAQSGKANLISYSPIDERAVGSVRCDDSSQLDKIITQAEFSFIKWRSVPAPVRGMIVREIGDELRRNKKELGRLVTLETGKILAEGEGEIQEAIDIADFAVGCSGQL